MRHSFFLALAFVLLGCTPKHASEPDDVDLAPLRAAFHCDAPRDASATQACLALDAFANAGPLNAFPPGDAVEVWVGSSHCVAPIKYAAGDWAINEVVYLSRKPSVGAPAEGDRARLVEGSALFGSSQTNRAAQPKTAGALDAVAAGKTPDKSSPPEAPIFPALNQLTLGQLLRTKSGRTMSDGTVDHGSNFLRSDGTQLLLVSKLQGGCASKLYRVPLPL